MSTEPGQKLEESLALIARQLLELNGKLAVLPEIQRMVLESNRSIQMIRGWMDGQEEITASHARSLSSIDHLLRRFDDRLAEHSGKLESVASFAASIDQKLGGNIELTKSAFDIFTALKDELKNRGLITGDYGHQQAEARQ